MTLLLTEGFELDIRSTWTDLKWVRSGADTDLTGLPGRKHGTAQRSQGFSGTNLDFAVTSQDRFVCGFGILPGDSGTKSEVMFRFNGSRQLGLTFIEANNDVDNQIQVTNGVTTYNGPALLRGRWYYIEFEATIHPSTGSFTVWVDDVQVMNETGIDTAGEGSAGVDTFRIRLGNVERHDDIYLLDDQGVDNARLGPIVIEKQQPDGDGVTLEWDPDVAGTHFTRVNDSPTAGSVGTSRVVADADNLTDLFDFEDSVALANAVTFYSIEVSMVFAMDGSGTRDVQAKFRDTGGGTASGSTHSILGTVPKRVGQIWRTNPVTAAAFTPASLDAAQVGVVSVP